MAVEPVGGLARWRVGGLAQGDDQSLPVVSVIVPVFNGERTIEACLASLLGQDYPKERYEVIVVDNRSTDRTASLVQRFPVRYVLEDRVQGSYAARNRGVREASGELLAFTDADCVASPDWIRQGVAGFTSSEIGCVAGGIRPLESKTLAQRYAAAHRALSHEAGSSNGERRVAYTANAFYRKATIERLGGFDPTVRSGGDADLSRRMSERLALRIAVRPEAGVSHQHRETVRELLRQRRHYGYGSVINYLKHRRQRRRRTLREGWWELRALLVKIGRFVRSLLAGCWSLGRSAQARERIAMDGLDVLVFLAKKTGQAQAAWKHRVWYF